MHLALDHRTASGLAAVGMATDYDQWYWLVLVADIQTIGERAGNVVQAQSVAAEERTMDREPMAQRTIHWHSRIVDGLEPVLEVPGELVAGWYGPAAV
jgi:hypothetical protein